MRGRPAPQLRNCPLTSPASPAFCEGQAASEKPRALPQGTEGLVNRLRIVLPLGRRDVNYRPGSTHFAPAPPTSSFPQAPALAPPAGGARDSARGEVTPLLDWVLKDFACSAGTVQGRGLPAPISGPGAPSLRAPREPREGPGGTGGGGGTRGEPGGKELAWGSGVTETLLTMERKQILEPKVLEPAFSSSK